MNRWSQSSLQGEAIFPPFAGWRQGVRSTPILYSTIQNHDHRSCTSIRTLEAANANPGLLREMVRRPNRRFRVHACWLFYVCVSTPVPGRLVRNALGSVTLDSMGTGDHCKILDGRVLTYSIEPWSSYRWDRDTFLIFVPNVPNHSGIPLGWPENAGGLCFTSGGIVKVHIRSSKRWIMSFNWHQCRHVYSKKGLFMTMVFSNYRRFVQGANNQIVPTAMHAGYRARGSSETMTNGFTPRKSACSPAWRASLSTLTIIFFLRLFFFFTEITTRFMPNRL